MSTWKEKEAAIRLLEKNGKVDVDDLIRVAIAESHPCHECFTWDDAQAAQERRRDQARALVRRVTFSVQYADATESVVMYVPSSGEEHKHRSLPKIRSKDEAREMMLVEVRQLHGVASRVYGIAIAKKGTVGSNGNQIVSALSGIRDAVADVKAMLEG
jgi:hypothetical protein